MNRPTRNVILAGLVFSTIWGGLFYYFAQIYPDDWLTMVQFGLGVPLVVMWYAMSAREIVSDSVESIRHERLRESLKLVAGLPFFRYIVGILILVVFMVLSTAISIFWRAMF